MADPPAAVRATKRGGGPRLDEAEWILLLDIFLRHGSLASQALTAELEQASAALAARAASRGGVRNGTELRSVEGLRRRLVELRKLSRGEDLRVPSLARDVWGRYRRDPGGVRHMARALLRGASAAAPHNPDWTREETLLALAAYLRIRPAFAARTSPEIVALSARLRLFAAQRRLTVEPTFRNAAGVARKVDKFRAAEADLPPSHVRGARLEETIWRAFLEQPAALLAEARAIEEAIARAEAPASPPSRGPVPSFGPLGQCRSDGSTDVYLFILCGPVERLYGDFAPDREGIFKIGRSNETVRRADEMNCGFPPGCGLFWHAFDRRSFASVDEAHSAEQALLGRLAAGGCTIGGEFARINLADAGSLLRSSASERSLASLEIRPV